MKRYDEWILGKLLDRYESSLLYTGKNQVHITIAVPIQKSTLPEYFDESSLKYDLIHEQLEALEELGYIRLVWKNKKRGHILEKCELVVEQVPQIYAMLKRTPRKEKECAILRICQKYEGKAAELDRFLSWLADRIRMGESVRKYVDLDEPEKFSGLCELVYRILTNQSECFLRQFSIQYFHDSKAAESEIEKAARIVMDFSGDDKWNGVSCDELLEEYNIYRNPSWTMLKGDGAFQIVDRNAEFLMDIRLFSGGIGISNRDMERMQWSREHVPGRIVTIENLTSFHQWDSSDADGEWLCIYLGGYHNQVKRQFLKNLYRAYPEAEYYHFGDLDCGGFRIWKDLRQKTGIPFVPMLMDCDTYEKYMKWGKELTAYDRKTLKLMCEDPFFADQKDLFMRMLCKGKKLEQECVMRKSN